MVEFAKTTNIYSYGDIDNVDDIDNIEEIFKNLNLNVAQFKLLKLIGEIITWKISDQNAWITIKINDYQFTCVFWKIVRTSFNQVLKNCVCGDKLILKGSFSIMKKNFLIYFIASHIEKFGKGNYIEQYNQLRQKIYTENIKTNRKILKNFPLNIGIITSLEGAAIQDIKQTFKLDNFIGNVFIKNAIVQGSQCPKSLCACINWFEENFPQKLDLLMISRGGGSWEDLVGFSDWNVVILIANSNFITISAVGHQIDNQLSDEVADYKFATPSIGAKFIVETQQKYLNKLAVLKNYLFDVFEKYYLSIDKFNTISDNYDNIMEQFNKKIILNKFTQISKFFNNILDNYVGKKNIFLSKIIKFKPIVKILSKNSSTEDVEIFTMGELIHLNGNKMQVQTKCSKSKKIEIIFADGSIQLEYKITNYKYGYDNPETNQCKWTH